MDWMVIEQSLEEQLYLEAAVRDIRACEDLDAIRSICVVLTKQSWHQTNLLLQAVGYIAELDAGGMSSL